MTLTKLNPYTMATLQLSEGSENPPLIIHRNKQLLSNIVDGMAKTRLWAIYAEIPQSSDSYKNGYRKVTYRALANAINGVAWSLKEMLGASRDHQTLAYIGTNDLGYVMMVLGAVKAGYKVSALLEKSTACLRKTLWSYCSYRHAIRSQTISACSMRPGVELCSHLPHCIRR